MPDRPAPLRSRETGSGTATGVAVPYR
jgi:hypothetical protein